MNVFDLVASITLDSSQYSAELGKAKSEGESMGGAIGGALSTAANVGMAAIGAATTAVVGFAGAAVQTGKEFDSSMSQVYATMGDKANDMVEYNGKTISSMEALRDFAQEMGATTAFSASQSAEALNYMALAGYDAKTSMKMLPNVMNLAAAGGMELATASDMVTDAQTALGLTLEDTSVMVDQLAKASSSSNASVQQFGEAFLQIGATARSIKGGTLEMATVLGVMADNGIKGAEGGTHLRNILMSLQTPTKSGTEALEKMGMTYEDMYDSAGNMRAIPDIMLDIQKKTEGMTQAQKDAIVSGLFNKFDVAAANALIGTTADRYNELSAAIKDSGGAAETMAKVQLDNLEGDITYLKSAFEGFQITVANGLMPEMRKFVQFGQSGLEELTKAFKEGGLSGAMDAFQGILTKGLDMILAEIPNAVDAGIQLLGAIGQGIYNALPTLGNAAIQLLQMLGNYIVQYAPILIAAIPSLLEQLASGIRTALNVVVSVGVDIINSIVQGITDNLPSFAESAPEIIGELLAALIENAPKILTAGLEIINAIYTGAQQALPILIENMPEMFEKVGEAIQNVDWIGLGQALINAVLAGLKMSFFTIPMLWLSIGQTAFEYLKNIDWIQLGKDVVTLVVNGVQNFFNKLPDKIREIGDTAHRWFKSIDWKQLGKDTITMIKDGIQFLFNDLPNLLHNIGTEAFQTVQSIDWYSLGSDIINGIINGVQNLASALVDTVSSIASDAYDAVKDFFDINSPSKKMMWIGEMVDKGMAKGISDSADLVENAMDGLTVTPEINTTPYSDETMGGTSNTANNNVTINVYGAVGQDMNELAEIIEQKITAATRRREGAFA